MVFLLVPLVLLYDFIYWSEKMWLKKLEFQDVRIHLFQTLGWGAPHNHAYFRLTGPHRNDLRNKNKFFQSRRNWMSTKLQINLLNPLSLVSKIPMSSPSDMTLTVKFLTPSTFLIIFFHPTSSFHSSGVLVYCGCHLFLLHCFLRSIGRVQRNRRCRFPVLVRRSSSGRSKSIVERWKPILGTIGISSYYTLSSSL